MPPNGEKIAAGYQANAAIALQIASQARETREFWREQNVGDSTAPRRARPSLLRRRHIVDDLVDDNGIGGTVFQ